MSTIIYKELAYGSKPVRVLIDEGGTIWLCAYDICRVMSRPQFMCTNPIHTMCPSAVKLKFDPRREAMWAIRRKDVAKYFYLIKNESSHTARTYKQVVEWTEGLTPEVIVNASGVTHKTVKAAQNKTSSSEITVFQYNGTNISFLIGEGTTINATEMAQAFNKSVYDWTRQKSAKEFVKALSAVKGIPCSALIQTVRGGNEQDQQGTWMHEDVAIEFARWLSPAFAIWCNDRIKELLSHGMTAMPKTLDEMIDNPDLVIGMAMRLKEERAAKELAQRERAEALQELSATSNRLSIATPKANYYDAVIEARELYTTLQLAGELGMCYRTLRCKLAKLGVVTTEKGPAILTSGHEDWGEMVMTPGPKKCEFLKWNKLGREKIFALINPELPT